MLTNIFVYGTLMFEPVWRQVTGCFHKSQKAILAGYERKSVKGQVYPVLIPSIKPVKLDGLVYFDINEEVLYKLDYFEGEVYSREKIKVKISGGKDINAQTYVLKTEYYRIIDDNIWDPLRFKREHMVLFLK